jgi:hypothetical protein
MNDKSGLYANKVPLMLKAVHTGQEIHTSPLRPATPFLVFRYFRRPCLFCPTCRRHDLSQGEQNAANGDVQHWDDFELAVAL